MIRKFALNPSTVFVLVALALAATGCNDDSTPTATPSASSTVGSGATTSGPPAVLTYHNDLARDGQNLVETKLTRANVNSTTFGKIGALPVDGLVQAQPLYVPGVSAGGSVQDMVFIATQHDSVYAYNADSLSTTPIWHRNFVSDCITSPSTPSNCSTATPLDSGAPNVSPEIGITSTPVIDAVAGTMYVVAFTKEGGSSNPTFYWRLHALSLSTGAEQPGSPITIDASYPGTGQGEAVDGLIYFDPPRQLQRAGLVLNNGMVYVPFTSFNDQDPAHGWLMAYNANTLEPVSVWMTTPNSGVGTIWMSGGAPAVDSSGNLFFVTGNGDASYFETTQGGPPNTFIDLSDSVVKLSFGSQGFDLADYFTPYNWAALSIGDVEVGSGGVVLLPDQPGAHPHLMVTGGKQGTVYLLDRDNLGKVTTSTTGDPQIVQEIPGIPMPSPVPSTAPKAGIPGGKNYGAGIYGTPSYYNGAVFIAPNVDYLRKIPISNGVLDWASMTAAPYQIKQRGATASISANGNSNGIIWYIDSSAYTYTWTPGKVPPTLTYGSPILYAFSTDDLSKPLYASNMVASDAADAACAESSTAPTGSGCAVKFAVPTVVNGKVFVGSDNEVTVYGLRSTVAAVKGIVPERAIAGVKKPIGVKSSNVKFEPSFFKMENSCPLNGQQKDGALF